MSFPGHLYLLWIPVMAGQGLVMGGRCWVSLALPPGLLLTSRKIVLFSFYRKDKKKKLGKVSGLFILTNNFQIKFL